MPSKNTKHVKKTIKKIKKNKRALKIILPILIILLLALAVCYIVLPWQVPTATIINKEIANDNITITAKVSRSLQIKSCKIALNKDKELISSQEITKYNTDEIYDFHEISEEGLYEITITYINIISKQEAVLITDSIQYGDAPIYQSADLSIHFLELGNKYTGDSVYIKAGDTDVLIDAGSKKNSATTIKNYLNTQMDDNKLEYVIATHAHEDHIAGFVGSNADKGIFETYEVETIIDYPKTDSTSQISKDYATLRDTEVSQGAKHYTALECVNKVNGATDVYELADGITLTVLNSYYYTNKASTENDYSVCVLISANDKHFLFTGDLESGGEEKLVELNDLPEVEVYKGGHHGSKTSSSDALLSVIKPKRVCVCTCAGSTQYTTNNDNIFPSQEFINRVAKYTQEIYITTLCTDYKNNIFTSMNGNIVVSVTTTITVNCSNNNTILKETDWFKANRVWPSA